MLSTEKSWFIYPDIWVGTLILDDISTGNKTMSSDIIEAKTDRFKSVNK